MKNPFASSNLSDAARRRVDLAVAMAQERLLNTHVEHALGLIDLVGDQIAFDSALDIYTRLLRLSEDEARIVTTQTLARLGERSEQTGLDTAELLAADDADPARDRRSILENLRQRMRGRVHDDLRRLIELQAARAEVAVLETHVENSLHFCEILREEIAANEAVELYLEALEVRDSIAEVVYYFSLARIGEKQIARLRAHETPQPPSSRSR